MCVCVCVRAYMLSPSSLQPSEKWLTVNLDMDRGLLWFERNNQFLGIAFDNLPTHEPLYPSLSAVFGNTSVTLVYIGQPVLG